MSSSGLVQIHKTAALFIHVGVRAQRGDAIWNINGTVSIPFTLHAEVSHSERGKMQSKLGWQSYLHADMRR